MRLSPFSRGWNRPSCSRWRFSCLKSHSASLLIFSPASGSFRLRGKTTSRQQLAARPLPARGPSTAPPSKGENTTTTTPPPQHWTKEPDKTPQGRGSPALPVHSPGAVVEGAPGPPPAALTARFLRGGEGEASPASPHRTDAGRLRRWPRIQAGPPAPPPAAGPARLSQRVTAMPGAEAPSPIPSCRRPSPASKWRRRRRRPLVFVLAARRWPHAERSLLGPAGEAPPRNKVVRAHSRTLGMLREGLEIRTRLNHPAAALLGGKPGRTALLRREC